jgi:hypothetical protein
MMVVIFFLGTSGYGVAAYHFVVGYVDLVSRGGIKRRSCNVSNICNWLSDQKGLD